MLRAHRPWAPLRAATAFLIGISILGSGSPSAGACID